MRRQQYLLYFTLFQVLVGFGIVIPILPHFALELGATSFHMGLITTVWAIAQFLFSPMWGAFSDRIGRRPVLLIGLIGYVLSFVLMGVAQNIWMVMLARFLGGLLSAATIPTAQAYVADTSTGEERTQRMSAMGAAMNLGFMSGPALGGLLAAAGLGFRATFLVAGGMAVVNLVLAYFTLPEPAHRRAAAARKGFSGLKAVSIAMAGPEVMLYLLAFAGTFGGSAMFSMLGFFLKDRMQAGPEALAVALTVEGVCATLFQGVLVGRSAQRFGEERSVAWSLLVGAGGFLTLVFARSFWHVLVGVVLISVAISFVRPLVTAMVSKRTRLEQGVTMGIQTAFDALGRSLGPLWSGAVYLWRDWAPFATSVVVYLLFYGLIQTAWRRVDGMPEPSRGAP